MTNDFRGILLYLFDCWTENIISGVIEGKTLQLSGFSSPVLCNGILFPSEQWEVTKAKNHHSPFCHVLIVACGSWNTPLASGQDEHISMKHQWLL